MIKKPEVGDLVLHNGRQHIVTHVWPILSKGSATQRNVEVKVEGYGVGLRHVPYHEREYD